MAFDWRDYLRLAEHLATEVDEASKRSSISRAYYFVLNVAFARAVATGGIRPLGISTHVWCWGQYQKTPDRLCRQLGSIGQRMKRRRVKADYDDADIPRLDDEVQLMLDEARRFQTDLSSLNPRYPSP